MIILFYNKHTFNFITAKVIINTIVSTIIIIINLSMCALNLKNYKFIFLIQIVPPKIFFTFPFLLAFTPTMTLFLKKMKSAVGIEFQLIQSTWLIIQWSLH